jgi:hypothetical protein
LTQHRKKFSPKFKAEAVQFVLQTDWPVAEIVRELDRDRSRRFLPRWAGFPAVEMVLAANPMG